MVTIPMTAGTSRPRVRVFRVLTTLALLASLIATLPPAAIQAQDNASDAWLGEYFSNPGLSGTPAFTRDDATVDFNWGNGSPAPGFPADNFSVRWTRTLDLEAGSYIFSTYTDDGVRLFVDGELVIDEWVPRSATDDSVELELAGGPHDIRMEYFEAGGQAVARLGYVLVGTGTAEVIRIDSGGDGFIDGMGNQWLADQYFSGGGEASSPQTIWNTDDGGLYVTERRAATGSGSNSFAYQIPVDSGASYIVRLHFAETFHSFRGLRQFGVAIEGSEVLSNFDIFAAAGGKATLVTRSYQTTVSDAELDITFTSQVDVATVNALEVFPATTEADLSNPVAAPVPEPENVSYSTPPTITLSISDNQNLNAGSWRIDDEDPQALFSSHEEATFATQFALPLDIFNALPLGSHTLTFLFNDDNGNAEAIQWRFRKVASGGGTEPISFSKELLANASTPGMEALEFPTVVEVGPDGRLYVGQQSGYIYALTLDDDRNVTDVERIDTIHDTPNFTRDGEPAPDVVGRMLIGFEFDPASTPQQPILWMAHSDPQFCFGTPPDECPINTDSGMLTRLAGPNFDDPANRTDFVTGLPRSMEIHTPNSVHLGPDGWLYLTLGSDTNFGAPSLAFSHLPERYLTASMVRFNVHGAAGAFPIDVRDVTSEADMIPGVFELYATGYRNAYDFLFHSNGTLYLNGNNGNAGSGPTPGPEDGCPDGVRINPGTRLDYLTIVEEGDYGGHPNPARDECILADGQMYSPPKPAEPGYREPILYYENGTSTNGMDEYDVGTFGGQMLGNIVSATWSGDQAVRRVVLSDDGQSAIFAENLATFQQPLDVAVGPDGTIFVAVHGAGTIEMLVPDTEASGFWDVRAPMPVATEEAVVVACEGLMYAIGGITPAEGPVNNVWSYDPETDFWSELAGYPGGALTHQGTACLDGKIYLFGGFPPGGTAVATFFAYDIASDRWTQLADMPRALGAMAVETFNGRIYAAGGLPVDAAEPGAVTDSYAYDPSTDSWETLASLPTPRDHLVLKEVGGALYAIGGRSFEHDSVVDSNERYDPESDSWSTRAPMPSARAGMVAGTLNGRIQIWGGEGPDGNGNGVYPQGEEYDPQTDTWRPVADMISPRHSTGSATIGDAVYVPGGGPAAGTTFSDVHEVFSFVSQEPPVSCIDEGSDQNSTDSDGDGYTDQDEMDNATNPCSPASAPPDFDMDGISNLNDPDDDNDGVPDTDDPFQLDPENGAATELPWVQTWNPDAGPAGFLGNTGFPGVQLTSNGTGFIKDNVFPGGAGGFLVIRATPGTNQGATNSQDNALQVGFDATNGVTISARVGDPFSGVEVTPGKSGGIYFGLDEDNYVKLVVAADNGSGEPGIVFAVETDGTYVENPDMVPPGIPMPGPTTIDLILDLDPAAQAITASYRLDSSDPSSTVRIGSIDAATFPELSDFFVVGAAAGVLTTNLDASSFATAFDQFQIEPGGANQAPTASASAIPTSGDAPLAVEFSSAGASDPDGDPLSYDWDFGDGSPGSNEASPAHTYTTPGTYTATLTVDDGRAGTDTDTVLIDVGDSGSDPSECPTGAFLAEYFNNKFLSGTPEATRCVPAVDFDWSSGSPAPGIDADRFSVRWVGVHTFATADAYTFTARTDDGMRVFVDGNLLIDAWIDQAPTSYSATTNLTAGEHEIRVEYYEHTGGALAEVSWVQASAVNMPPTVNASAQPTSGVAPLAVQFSSSGTSDPDGDPLSYSWDFGDGSALSTAANPTHTYQATGTYTATLTVGDGNGGVASDSVIISVVDDPLAQCGAGEFLASYYNNKFLSGTPALERCEAAIDHQWGTAGPAPGIDADRFSVRWTGRHEFTAAGDYTFSATADDGIRVYVDGNLIIDAWKDQGPTLYTASVTLTAGEHDVIVEYYEHTGGATVIVNWELDE